MGIAFSDTPVEPQLPDPCQLYEAVMSRSPEVANMLSLPVPATVFTEAVAKIISSGTLSDLEFLLSHNPPRDLFGQVTLGTTYKSTTVCITGSLLHFLVLYSKPWRRDRGTDDHRADVAASVDTVHALKLLWNFISVNECANGQIPLISHSIAAGGGDHYVRYLHSQGARLNGIPNPPLLTAVVYNDSYAADSLISLGAIPDSLTIINILQYGAAAWLKLIFKPRIVDITRFEESYYNHNRCRDRPFVKVETSDAVYATEPLHVHLRKNPQYFAVAQNSFDRPNKYELLVRNGADPDEFYRQYEKEHGTPYPRGKNWYIERGRLYRIAIYTYLCVREAYGRDIATLIAKRILKLRCEGFS